MHVKKNLLTFVSEKIKITMYQIDQLKELAPAAFRTAEQGAERGAERVHEKAGDYRLWTGFFHSRCSRRTGKKEQKCIPQCLK